MRDRNKNIFHTIYFKSKAIDKWWKQNMFYAQNKT